jgi:hypothetical protein
VQPQASYFRPLPAIAIAYLENLCINLPPTR